jgi:transcription-repair coupling factor (superfamily II helicase)
MQLSDLLNKFSTTDKSRQLQGILKAHKQKVHLKKLTGSAVSFYLSSVVLENNHSLVFIANTKEDAGYFYNDFESILKGNIPVFYYPESGKKPYEIEETENANIAIRAEVLQAMRIQKTNVVVTYPEAIAENVISKKELKTNSFELELGTIQNLDFINEMLIELEFHKVDYVFEPGQFSIRGGIIDIFSFANEHPYRVELFGDEIESMRTFDPVTQLSVQKMQTITIVPNINSGSIAEEYEPFMEYFQERSSVAIEDVELVMNRLDKLLANAESKFKKIKSPLDHKKPSDLFQSGDDFQSKIFNFNIVEFGLRNYTVADKIISFQTNPQPVFRKNFELLIENLKENERNKLANIIVANNATQIERLYNIFDNIGDHVAFDPFLIQLKEGFTDIETGLAIYTDHQIFERHKTSRLKTGFKKTKEAITLQELMALQPGDYVTHIDHGIGKFSGLEKIEVNGKMQEAIRLIYKGNDIMYVNIHSLHRIAKYSGKEGAEPKINKLGSGVWQKTKSKTKNRMKKLAYDLIKLYAKRKEARGFAFAPDTYLQTELEASFMYEDTPDQFTATQAIKADMEKPYPMDRLVCGDVGFGKTEIAIRAALKAVADSKQVAVLVPTTILCLQHYKTFSARLREFPVNVDYVNRFKTAKETTLAFKNLKEGKTDILIGTHKLLSKRTEFKDLGLFIVDEEQKFGVGAKDKLKLLRANVDTLTLTATPIPRTLQFSLMGARDLSIIKTAPPNRQPVHTELIPFNETIIRDAIVHELKRGGQVFFINNRVQNIAEVASLIQRLVPSAKVTIGHGQMDGKKLETLMMDFIDGQFDVLVSTTIVESGIDIPNANTMIINNAQNFGLSDLHQLRGRVGRSNKEAFCYLVTPPMHMVSDDSRKRLQAIEQFNELGSGMNIAMRDLDIRGAGDLLGSEQSGFIGSIGYEMYQKILNEAIKELKEEEFQDLFEEDNKNKNPVEDVTIETDFEIMFPDDYIPGNTEKIILYKQLDDLKTSEELIEFKNKLIDRFGPLPPATEELLEILPLKWLAQKLGIEKLVLKSEKMIGYFIKEQNHSFYQSENFTKILRFIQKNPAGYSMIEKNDRLRITHIHITSTTEAINALKPILS